MKIGIDTFGCAHGKSGLGSYLSSLSAQLKNTDENTFELFGSEIDRYTYGAENGLTYSSVKLPDNRSYEKFWHYAFANLFARKHKYNAVLYAAGARYLPLFYTVPGVAVVYDVLSEMYASEILESKTMRILIGLKNASRVIAASHFIRKDLIKLGVPEEKITVIYNGINHSEFYPREDLSPNLLDIKPFAIKRPYFIYPSQISSSSKKHVELIKAFTIFKEKTRLEHRLVLTGTEGDSIEDVKNAIMESSCRQDIFITGFFPHESFPLLYAGSDGCIFPSVNEGVGLPVLESLAAGIPVACSDAGALPEIAGDNAVYFNSDDIMDIEKAMEKLALDNILRKKLKEGGIEWTKRFSWEKTAEKTIEVLSEVAN
jgi:glycosyltransferase involved in cell wall biosynthesis